MDLLSFSATDRSVPGGEYFSFLDKRLDNCSLEDARYRRYVLEKIYRGIERAAKQGTISQVGVERKFA